MIIYNVRNWTENTEMRNSRLDMQSISLYIPQSRNNIQIERWNGIVKQTDTIHNTTESQPGKNRPFMQLNANKISKGAAVYKHTHSFTRHTNLI